MPQSTDLPEKVKEHLRGIFKDVGTKAGMEVFRIENFEAKPWNNPGHFYDGDCYLVMKTTSKSKGSLESYLHIWIGSESSQDEQGAAAMNAYYLDEFLDGKPIQVREEQGSESNRFLGYFEAMGKFEVQKGGVKSGFQSVTRHKLESRLYRVKGRGVSRITQMDLSVGSLNSGDVFILDTDNLIYIWAGKHALGNELYTAGSKADIFKLKTHGGKCETVVVYEGDGTPAELEFYQVLGHEGSLGSINISPAIADDDICTQKRKKTGTILYRIHKEPGREPDPPKVVFQGKDGGVLKREMLDKTDAFVLFTNDAVYAWSGTHDTKEEKQLAFEEAQKLVKDHNLKIPIYKISQHMEPANFTQNFNDWYTVSAFQPKGSIAKTNPHAPTVHKRREKEHIGIKKRSGGRFSIYKVLSKSDEDSGEYDEDEIENERYALTVDEEGRFGDLYAENCYLMYYEDSQESAVFYWLGKDAKIELKGKCAALAIKMDDEHDGKPVQVRQEQGRETDDLLQFFQETDDSPCRLIVYRGKDPRSGRNPTVKELKPQIMFEISGTQKSDTSAYEVEYSMGSLNSNNCFVIKNGHSKTIWYGKYSNGDERDYCKKIYIERLFPNDDIPAPVLEGTDADTKWKIDTFGSDDIPYSDVMKPEVMSKGAPTLYQLSNASGYFEMIEIPGYKQIDLVQSDVMILTTDNGGFIWHGIDSRKDEQIQAVEETAELMKTKSVTSQIYTIKQGNENPLFKSYFDSWDNFQWENLKHSDKAVTQSSLKDIREMRKGDYKQYPLELLKSDNPPSDVDCSQKEKYLSPKDFLEIFHMDMNTFLELPKWKQINFKKAAGLF